MPPVVKYSKEKILETALNIVNARGIECVSARNIAKELGCSICPIFSCYESMNSLFAALIEKMRVIYVNFLEEKMKLCEKPYKGAGLAYIGFAREYKNYFKALFMNDFNGSSITSMLDDADANFDNEVIIGIISKTYGISKEDAKIIHSYNWIFVHGIATMLVTSYCNFSDEEIDKMLSVEYQSLLKYYKENK